MNIVVDSNDLHEWGKTLATFGGALTTLIPHSTAGAEIKKIGDQLSELARTAPPARQL
jgi:hypothetical protein